MLKLHKSSCCWTVSVGDWGKKRLTDSFLGPRGMMKRPTARASKPALLSVMHAMTDCVQQTTAIDLLSDTDEFKAGFQKHVEI